MALKRVTKIAWRIRTGNEWWSGTDTAVDMEIYRDSKLLQRLRLEPGRTTRLHRSEDATYFWVFKDPDPDGIGVSYSGFTPPYYEEFPQDVRGHLKVKFIARGDDEAVTRFERTAAMPGYENIWHTDVTWRPAPALGSVLRLIEVPPVGGDTMWADMAAAYDNLPEDVRARIDGLTAVHDYLPGFDRFSDPALLARWQDRFPPVEHPVVRTHPETGRRTLFVNQAFTTHIVGLDRAESDRLLRYLFLQAHTPEFQVRFSWRPDSVAFWDNRATQHYAVNDYHPHVRIAERVAIAGDRPY